MVAECASHRLVDMRTSMGSMFGPRVYQKLSQHGKILYINENLHVT